MLTGITTVLTFGQGGSTGINSPYTRFGYGRLSEQRLSATRAMGGTAYALRDGSYVNTANPASYSAVDSLTFLFDAGMSLHYSHFDDNGVKTNVQNGHFDYVAMQFRLRRGLGFTAALLPFSRVGYNFTQTDQLPQGFVSTNVHSGSGSLQQIMAGIGWMPVRNLSVGANVSYLYGDLKHSVSASFNNPDASSSAWFRKISVSDYKLDFGAQYSYNIDKRRVMTLGATFSPGHDLGAKGYYTMSNIGGQGKMEKTDTITNGFRLPTMLGVGVSYVKDNRLTLAADYSFQKWGGCDFFGHSDQMTDRHVFSLGTEFRPNAMSRNYLKRIRYRAGVKYSSSYVKVNGLDGPKEYSVMAGFGLPMWNSKSILNISAEYLKEKAGANMLRADYFRVNVGLTFNERWFMKWRVN